MRRYLQTAPFILYPLLLLWMVRNDPFFWDTVQLASKHAHFFYENQLKWAPLPSDIDSGHPPVLGYYVAGIWAVFGKNLPASHWAMTPFLLVIILCLYRLGRRFGGQNGQFWLFPIVLLDPVMAGQMLLVSPDLILAAWLLLTLVGVFESRNSLIVIGILGLCTISMRGMMTCAALGVWVLARGGRPVAWADVRNRLRMILLFAPGVLAAILFLYWHQVNTGWTGYHPGSSWAPAFARVGWSGFWRNVAILAWRWLDFGRVAEWGAVVWLVYKGWGRQRIDADLWLLLLCAALFLSPSALMYQGLSAHRYFLPLFIILHLVVFQGLASVRLPALRFQLLTTALVLFLATGNRWIYPRGISMDWDATLAHQPWHGLRAQALAWLDANHIDYQEVGSAFPNLASGEQLMLNGDARRFAPLDFKLNRYVFVSNIMNDVEERDYQFLSAHWQLVRRFEQAGVWVELYKQ